MTIGDVSPKEKRSGKKKITFDENTPLLPKSHGGDSSYGHFDEFNGASFMGAVFNLSTTIVGAGIMALPATMKVLGLGLGIAMIVFMAFLTEKSIEFLVRFSRVGKICVLINNIGVLIVYMIIIGDVLSGTSSSGVHHAGVLEGWFGDHWWNGRSFVLIVTTLGVFAPLACFKRIDSLRFTSALSVALAVVFLVIMVFTVVPVLVTAYICHYNVHNIDNELEDSTQITAVVRTSLAMCSSVYILTSFFGFLLFGDGTLDDVLANFDTDLGIPRLLPSPTELDGLLFPSARPLASSNARFASITAGLIVLIFLGANFIPSIWDAFQFTGATAAVCLGFIFPAAVTLRDRFGVATRKDKILGVLMIVLAVFSNLVAIYSDAYSLFKKNEKRE
ncbi:hypothetical protein MLD38_033846 [Melastoma candidum]|uniref:Uncharacterized protein n=1 Tax=Melastoma candidum TaxID=119954 RepID=A0ACB9M822_9MYRT|nr:hypothetical protein MLD38_033846 [Melastoma candidum]